MSKVLIIGAGGVGTVVAHKVAKDGVFTDIMLASRTKSKCDQIAQAIGDARIQTAQVDADNVQELVALMKSFQPDIVINVALPYQDLTILWRVAILWIPQVFAVTSFDLLVLLLGVSLLWGFNKSGIDDFTLVE